MFTFPLNKQISVDVTEVEFGSQVLGETRKRIINVTNNGALGTQFEFKKITGTKAHLVCFLQSEFFSALKLFSCCFL